MNLSGSNYFLLNKLLHFERLLGTLLDPGWEYSFWWILENEKTELNICSTTNDYNCIIIVAVNDNGIYCMWW